MAYTYRFVDTDENVIYVGYTGQTMAKKNKPNISQKVIYLKGVINL